MISYWITAAVFFLADTNILYIGERMDAIDHPVQYYLKALPTVLRNQLLIHLPTLSYLPLIADNRSVIQSAINLVINMVISAIGFSLAHHALHLYAYSSIHKKHHEFSKVLISITSEYNSLTEEFITWFLCTWLPMYYFQMSSPFAFFYVGFNAIYGVLGHSCYRLPLFERDIYRHILHHKLFNYNYSGMEWYDTICGTNRLTIDEEGGSSRAYH